MTPQQREAALRLANRLDSDDPDFEDATAAAALLRELATKNGAEPVAYIHEWKSHAGVIGKTLHWQAISPHGDEVEVTPLYIRETP